MNELDNYNVVIPIGVLPSDWDNERKKEWIRHAWKRGRKDVALELYEAIAPVRPDAKADHYVVQIFETSYPPYDDYVRELRFGFKLSKVNYQPVAMPSYEDYSGMTLVPLSISAIGEIKRRVKRGIKKLWKK